MDNIVFESELTYKSVYARDAIIGKKYMDSSTGKTLGILSYKRYSYPIYGEVIGKYMCKFSDHSSSFYWNDVLIEINI